jgi:hypothetical protein
MLGGLPEVEQASLSDCLLFDQLALEQDGLCSTAVDVDLRFELTRKVAILEQDAVL